MASFHLAVKAIGRSAGRSATAAAAYRAGVEITDERTGLVHDYTRKQGVEHSELMLPTDAPEWAADRERLWNAAELAETRKNATVAREYEIALPVELSADERRELALGLAREISERHGVAVDVSIHAPGREGDQRNHHAHLLTTTRRLGPEGLGKRRASWTRSRAARSSGGGNDGPRCRIGRWNWRTSPTGWTIAVTSGRGSSRNPPCIGGRVRRRWSGGPSRWPRGRGGAMSRWRRQVGPTPASSSGPAPALTPRRGRDCSATWVSGSGGRAGLWAGDGGRSAQRRRRRAGRPAPVYRARDGMAARHGAADRGQAARCCGQLERCGRARSARGGRGATRPRSAGASSRRSRPSGSAGAPAGAGTRAGGREVQYHRREARGGRAWLWRP